MLSHTPDGSSWWTHKRCRPGFVGVLLFADALNTIQSHDQKKVAEETLRMSWFSFFGF